MYVFINLEFMIVLIFKQDHCLTYYYIFQAGLAGAPSRAVSAMKNMNIPQQLKDMKLPDLPQAIKELKF